MNNQIKEFISYTLWIMISFLVGIFFASLFAKTAQYAFVNLKTIVATAEDKNENLIVSYAMASVANTLKPPVARKTPKPKIEIIEVVNEETSLLFVGDIMLSRRVETTVDKYFGGDFSFLFAKVKSVVQDADISFGNLEGPASDTGRDKRNLYSFRMKPEALDAIKDTGFDVLSLANNHIGDWGRIAFEDTLRRMNEEELVYAGAGYDEEDAVTPEIIYKNGMKISFLAFTDVGPNWLRAFDDNPGILIVDEKTPEIIKNASKETDVLVVSFHFGNEYYNKSNSRQQKIARMAIDSGAKIVIGQHPHVVQEIEEYKDGIIAYSLGNFVFDQDFSEETMTGAMFEVTLSSEDGTIKSFNNITTKQNKYFQLELNEERKTATTTQTAIK